MAADTSGSPTAFDSETDLSSDKDFAGDDLLTVEIRETSSGTSELSSGISETSESTIAEDSDRQMQCFMPEPDGDYSTKSNEDEEEEDSSLNESSMKSSSCLSPAKEGINTSFFEYTTVNEKSGLFELDVKKLERKVLLLSLNETTEDVPSQKVSSNSEEATSLPKEDIMQSLRDGIREMFKKGESSDKQTEPEESSDTKEQVKEKLISYNYDRKNTLWDRKPLLREMGREFLQDKSSEVNFTERGLETFQKGLMNYVELKCSNILRRIAYSKLCEKHLLPEFTSGALAEEEEYIENISINVDHFEFLHEEVSLDFLELFKAEDFHSIALNWEQDPQINNIMPSFVEFLESNGYEYPKNCLTLILAVFKNPYRKIEVYDTNSSVLKEQIAIAEYLVNCLHILRIIEDKDIFEKLEEAIIRFANMHPVFLASLQELFNQLLSLKIHDTLAYQIYCKVVNLMTSIGTAIIDECLSKHFRKISSLAAKDKNCDLYFHLLKAFEISFSNFMENEPPLEAEKEIQIESSNDVDLASFHTACYNYFGRDLTTRLIPVFKKYEIRKDREEQYLSKKHSIFPTKEGYMDTEMRHLAGMNKRRIALESSNLTVKQCTFDSDGKVLVSSSNKQLGYVIKRDENDILSAEDLDYWETINNFPPSYLECVNGILAKNNYACN